MVPSDYPKHFKNINPFNLCNNHMRWKCYHEPQLIEDLGLPCQPQLGPVLLAVPHARQLSWFQACHCPVIACSWAPSPLELPSWWGGLGHLRGPAPRLCPSQALSSPKASVPLPTKGAGSRPLFSHQALGEGSKRRKEFRS